MKIIQAQTEHLDIVRELFREYQDGLDETSSSCCFEGFEKELASLPGSYDHPKGIIYIAFTNSDYDKSANAIGCVAIQPRKGKAKEAEIKRLYVRSKARGKGAGSSLLGNVFLFAKTLKYSSLFLETTASMQNAISLYESYGFEKLKNPKDNTIECYQYLFKQDVTKK